MAVHAVVNVAFSKVEPPAFKRMVSAVRKCPYGYAVVAAYVNGRTHIPRNSTLKKDDPYSRESLNLTVLGVCERLAKYINPGTVLSRNQSESFNPATVLAASHLFGEHGDTA